jgi:hypothetical protein
VNPLRLNAANRERESFQGELPFHKWSSTCSRSVFPPLDIPLQASPWRIVSSFHVNNPQRKRIQPNFRRRWKSTGEKKERSRAVMTNEMMRSSFDGVPEVFSKSVYSLRTRPLMFGSACSERVQRLSSRSGSCHRLYSVPAELANCSLRPGTWRTFGGLSALRRACGDFLACCNDASVSRVPKFL